MLHRDVSLCGCAPRCSQFKEHPWTQAGLALHTSTERNRGWLENGCLARRGIPDHHSCSFSDCTRLGPEFTRCFSASKLLFCGFHINCIAAFFATYFTNFYGDKFSCAMCPEIFIFCGMDTGQRGVESAGNCWGSQKNCIETAEPHLKRSDCGLLTLARLNSLLRLKKDQQLYSRRYS